METTKGSAAPASGSNDIPAFAALAADPVIARLLDFEPVVRKVRRPDGWTAELQRELIARIAATGTVQTAVWQMGKHATGAEALYKTPGADGFRASWDAVRRHEFTSWRASLFSLPYFRFAFGRLRPTQAA